MKNTLTLKNTKTLHELSILEPKESILHLKAEKLLKTNRTRELPIQKTYHIQLTGEKLFLI